MNLMTGLQFLALAPAMLVLGLIARVEAPPIAVLAPASTASAAASGCAPGFVPRRADADDAVCVGFYSRDRIRIENRLAAERADRGGGCRPGFAPREAIRGDAICVTPSAHAWVQLETAAASANASDAARRRTSP